MEIGTSRAMAALVAGTPEATPPPPASDADSEMLEEGDDAAAAEAPSLTPAGPLCGYGSRLSYTYFREPVPTPDQLAEAHEDTFWLTIDAQLVYLSFFQDTGPLNVAMFYRFALHLHSLLDDETLTGKKITLYSSADPDKKANAALLIALYAMIVMRWSPADALHPVACLELQPFRDAGYARADYHLSLQDIVFGMKKAIDARLLRLDTFDVKEYEMYEKVENGDWNFITPHFLAFASPVEAGYAGSAGEGPTGNKLSKAFRNVLSFFKDRNVRAVVRLNKKLYAAEHFTELGFEHVEMYVDDGSNPTMDMCREFIALSERVIKAGGVVAVHCKAGLGRTGTLMGAYFIYRWGFTAAEAIGFMRIMRPGSVVGPQQHFLSQHQQTFVKWAAVDAAAGTCAAEPALKTAYERPITPPSDTDAAIEPERPGTPTNSAAAVPGQPRKTPGRTRHAVAAPETAPQEADDAMEGVQSTPQPESAPSLVNGVGGSDAEDDAADDDESGGRETTPTDDIAANRPALRARQRPLSAITDSRVNHRTGSHSPPATASSNGVTRAVVPTRSKAARNLFAEAGASSGSERYNLRQASSRSPPEPAGAAAVAAAVDPAPETAAPTTRAARSAPAHPSPSRLPQRIAGKRRGTRAAVAAAAGGAANTQGCAPTTLQPGAAGGAATRLTRNVRRRRSSMGAADVLA